MSQIAHLGKDNIHLEILINDNSIIDSVSAWKNGVYHKCNHTDGFLSGSTIHNPSRIANNIKDRFVEYLSINKDMVYENEHAFFVAVVIHDKTITLFFNEDYTNNKRLLSYLTNPDFNKIKDINFLLIEK